MKSALLSWIAAHGRLCRRVPPVSVSRAEVPGLYAFRVATDGS